MYLLLLALMDWAHDAHIYAREVADLIALFIVELVGCGSHPFAQETFCMIWIKLGWPWM